MKDLECSLSPVGTLRGLPLPPDLFVFYTPSNEASIVPWKLLLQQENFSLCFRFRGGCQQQCHIKKRSRIIAGPTHGDSTVGHLLTLQTHDGITSACNIYCNAVIIHPHYEQSQQTRIISYKTNQLDFPHSFLVPIVGWTDLESRQF